MAERLRRQTANLIPSGCAGSNPVINEAFSVLWCAFFCVASANPVINEGVLVPRCLFVSGFCLLRQRILLAFSSLSVVCILVVARAVESSCVLVRRLRYLASRRRRRREIADGRARRVGGGRSHIRSSYPSFRPRLCRDGPTKCPQK